MRLLSKSLNECYFVISRYVEKHQKEKKVRELNKPKVVNIIPDKKKYADKRSFQPITKYTARPGENL